MADHFEQKKTVFMTKKQHWLFVLLLGTACNLISAHAARTVQDGPMPGSSGYDFHYVLADDETPESAKRLEKILVHYIESHPASYVHINEQSFAFNKKYNAANGPWKRAMWSLQVGTMPIVDATGKAINTANPEMIDPDKIAHLYRYMLQIAQFMKATMIHDGYKGSLLVHAMIYPDDSDARKERMAHYQTSWVVYGNFNIKDPNNFRDVWTSSLIPMEDFVVHKMKEGEKQATMQKQFLAHFQHDRIYTNKKSLKRVFKMLYQGQENLTTLQAALDKQQKKAG